MDRPLSHKVIVKIEDLDTNKLYAYPSILADAAAMIKAELVDAEQAEIARELMAEIEAVPYAEYDGSFAAEWIYTEDVAADIIN
jgi:hypothetical protein